MPEQRLWSCDDHGNAFYLSSWDAGWKRLRARRAYQLRVKHIAASSWCVWVIAADQSPYFLVPSDGTTIRVTEIITQHERWNPSTGFSAANLTARDPPEYVRSGQETFSWSALPSTRWQWESTDWEYFLEHSGDRAGWEYSSSFQKHAVFTSYYCVDSIVRRRRWYRVRRFLGHDRWLLCSIDLEPDKRDSQLLSRSTSIGVRKLALGGENFPHQQLGFLVLWAVTKDGQVVCRTDIHRNNPEGSSWKEHHLIFLVTNSNQPRPDVNQPYALDISVNQNGQVFVLTDENQLFQRSGVSWKYPYGVSWAQVVCDVPSSMPFRDHEHLVSVSVGTRSIWLLANTGRVWFSTISNLVSTMATSSPTGPSLNLDSSKHSFWFPMAGRLVDLAVSPFDQVFALDLHSNRLIYRSGITPETPGGESWLALDLPILPTFDEELKAGTSRDEEGPLLPVCFPQDEVIQLIARVLQLTNPSFDHRMDENLEFLSVPEDCDANAVDVLSRQISPAIILGHKLRRFFSLRNRIQINNFFVSFRHLLSKDSLEEKSGSFSRLSDDQTLPKFGHPPARLMSVWSGALNSPTEQSIPARWRIASLLTARNSMIPFFTLDMDISSPEWFQQIERSLALPGPSWGLKGLKFIKIFNDWEPWTETFTVEALQAPFNYSKNVWVGKQAVITHFASPSHLIEFSLINLSIPSGLSASDESVEITSVSQISNKLTLKEIAWAGFIDPLSHLVPRNAATMRRKFSGDVPIRKPGEETLTEVPKRTFPLPSLSTSSLGQLIAVFVHEDKASSTIESAIESEVPEEEEDTNCAVFEERTSVVKSHIVPRWILRFSSKAEATSWLVETQLLSTVLPSVGRIWMVTEQAEVFWAVGTNLDNTLTWNKVGGHFAHVDSISFSGKDGGQVTWALGYNGTPWVLRDDWTSACNSQTGYSNNQFPYSTPHYQTDIRQFRVYEFQLRRAIHGYSSSKAFNDRGVMWCRDAQHREPCSLCDIHLPPHNGRVRWLSDWEVDFSPLPGCASHHTLALLRQPHSGSRCEECGSELQSPSVSPRGSRRCGATTTEITTSSFDSLEVVVTKTTTIARPSPPSILTSDFKDRGTYSGSDEGFVYSTAPSCDVNGWIYTPRSSSWGHHCRRPRGGNSGLRHRRWVRSCAVCTEAPWQEVGPLKVKSISLSLMSDTNKRCVEVWAVTDSGELVCRSDVMPSNPAPLAMCSDSKRLPHLYAVQPNPFAYTQKYEEALDLIHGEIRKLFSNPNLLHTPEIASLMREIADEVAYLRFDNTILRTASPEWSKKFAERELVTQRQAFLETCKLLTDPGGKLTARYQVNMHSGKQNCNTIPCTYAELNKDLTGDRDIGIGWTDISQRSAEEWAAKELMGLRDQLKPLAEEAKKRIKQFLNEYGISDRYRGYRNNLGYFCNSERSRDIDSALLNPARPVIAPRWNLGVEEERAKAVDCTNCVALHDKNCKNSTRRCYFRQIVKDPVEAAGIPLKFPGKTEYEDAFIYPMLRYLPRTAKKPPSTHRSVSEQPPGIRGRGRSVESDVDVMQTRDYVSDPAMITGESHQELWMENRKTCDGFPKTEYQERFRNFSAEDLNPCTWRSNRSSSYSIITDTSPHLFKFSLNVVVSCLDQSAVSIHIAAMWYFAVEVFRDPMSAVMHLLNLAFALWRCLKGSSWVHYPTPRRLQCVAVAPESSSTHLWAVCAEFGLLWQSGLVLRDQSKPYDQLTWRCLGFSPTGAAWHRLAPVSARCLWALDVNGRLWVYLTNQRAPKERWKAVEDERSVVNWIKVASPMVSDISCSPDGKVWAVFSATNALALRTGISQKAPSGTGWLLAFEGIVASICIKGSSALS